MKKFNIYTSDNNTNISYLKKKQLLNNNFTEPAIQKNNICFTEENIPQNIGTHTIKIKSYVDKKNNGINSLLNSYTNKMSSLETPSNIQMIKQNNSNHSYFSLKYKNEKSNECQEINNFNLNTIDYNDTTSGLSVLQNGKDETFNQDFYDYLLQNLETNRKKANREYECDINNKKIIKNNNAKKKPYKDAFLKKILAL